MNTVGLVHPVASREEWLKARITLLEKEKMLTRLHDELSRERRTLPWVKIDKTYVFDGPKGRETLAQLFAGRSQLMVYHFMLGPGWQEGCKSCSYLADHIDGALIHLAHRDVTFLAISRAPLLEIQAFQKRMGWRFKWVSSFENDFNFDFQVSFRKDELAQGNVYYNYAWQPFPAEEAPGISVFYKNSSGEVFHTYSAYARGAESLIGTYKCLDLAPKGRGEDGLAFTMSWVRHHDRYDDGYEMEMQEQHVPPQALESRCAQGERGG
ncbi:MAG: DUF899 domain-containing protein [Bryobacteraceae bacterium]